VLNLPEIVLDVAQLSKAYRSRAGLVPAVKEITFSVGSGEFVSVVGPSGCGKTTLMMCIAGLNPITGGTVTFRGQPVSAPPRGLAVVFQDYSRSLFPWFTVEANVALPLRDRGIPDAQVREAVERALDMVGLRHAAKLHPWELSGGMQQRVAIARGLAMAPDVFIMDEPFASVDAQTRANLEDLLLDVWSELKTTVLFVTHDIDEAVYLSDRIIVLSQGPSVVRAEIAVPLPRSRDQLATKELPLFARVRHEVFTLVMESQRRTTIHGEGPA
jgi:NitT/TauT family transport system ATP-binding protein